MNSSDMAETSMMRDEPRKSPARVKEAEAAMKRYFLRRAVNRLLERQPPDI